MTITNSTPRITWADMTAAGIDIDHVTRTHNNNTGGWDDYEARCLDVRVAFGASEDVDNIGDGEDDLGWDLTAYQWTAGLNGGEQPGGTEHYDTPADVLKAVRGYLERAARPRAWRAPGGIAELVITHDGKAWSAPGDGDDSDRVILADGIAAMIKGAWWPNEGDGWTELPAGFFTPSTYKGWEWTEVHPLSELVEKSRRLLEVEQEAERLRGEITSFLIAEYATGRSLADVAAETGLKRGRIISWLKGAGVAMDRGPRNRYTAPSALPAQRDDRAAS